MKFLSVGPAARETKMIEKNLLLLDGDHALATPPTFLEPGNSRTSPTLVELDKDRGRHFQHDGDLRHISITPNVGQRTTGKTISTQFQDPLSNMRRPELLEREATRKRNEK